MKTNNREQIVREFAEVINRNSLENGSDTPDFILAEYLMCCLEIHDDAAINRQKWYGKTNKPPTKTITSK